MPVRSWFGVRTNLEETRPLDGEAEHDDPEASLRSHGGVDGPAPLRFGRFVVLRTLGKGGMGMVLSAYDDRLDRRVAIKVLHGEGSVSEWRTQVLREARALARLSHPNVVHVYEVGEQDDALFIVMEQIEGTTLRQWCRSEPRRWPEVLERFVAAGRGLAAAHEAGLVHRDFKPANVLLGDGGRVCVADFGLASVDSRDSALGPSISGASGVSGCAELSFAGDDVWLTHSRALQGTPSYMAPEQLMRETADARSDQFSFCVALFEALHGHRPFEGRSLAELQRNVPKGLRRELPRNPEVPVHITAAIDRGLHVTPDARWPSMAGLLDALLDDPARRRRQWAGGALALGVLGLAAWGYRELVHGEYELARSARERMCEDAAAELEAVWNDERRQRLRAAMMATALPYAEGVWAHVETTLDDYAVRWRAQHGEACEATHARGVQSEAMLDLRLACLGDRRRAVAALLDELDEPDPGAVQRAPQAVGSLPALDRCADLEQLAGQQHDAETPDEASREQVEAIEHGLAQVTARRQLGRYAAARDQAQALLAQGEVLPLRSIGVKLRIELALSQLQAGEPAAALQTMQEAYAEAETLGLDELRFDAGKYLIHVHGVVMHDREAGLWWGKQMLALLTRLGPAFEHNRADVLGKLAAVHDSHGDSAKARSLLEESLALQRHESDGDPFLYAATLADLGVVLWNLGELEAGRDHIAADVERLERMLGPEHPQILLSLINLAAIHVDLGQAETAVALDERALALARASLGSTHPMVGKLLSNLATAEDELGKHRRASDHFREGQEILERALGADDPTLVLMFTMNADHERSHGDPVRARALYERALVLAAKVHGESHPSCVNPLYGLAQLDAAQARHDEAREGLRRAIELQRAHKPEGLPELLVTLADFEREAGQPAAAEPWLHEALTLLAEGEGVRASWLRGAARLSLARSQRAQGRSLVEVEPLVRQASRDLVRAGASAKDERQELEQWWRGEGGAALEP
jgi:tetratricopeptide (TPR) repeat protein/predicted Ser/Thr protein kinase